jgi:hypothetical protein
MCKLLCTYILHVKKINLFTIKLNKNFVKDFAKFQNHRKIGHYSKNFVSL